MDALEDRVRRILQHPSMSAEAERVLAAVHAGARRRRRRAIATATAAAVVALGVAGAATLVVSGGDLPDALPLPTATPTTEPSGGPVTEATADGRPGWAVGTTGFDGTGPGGMWRVSAVPCTDSLCATVFREGSSAGWAPVASLAFDDPQDARRYELPPVESIRVADDGRSAWAFGLQLWSTHNGGSTWVRQELEGEDPLDRVEIETVGDQVFALQSSPLRIWRSAAAVDIWTSVLPPTGYAYADQITSVGDTLVLRATKKGSDRRRLLLSDDAGDTWRAVDAPCQGEVGPIRSTGTVLMTPCPADQRTDPDADLAVLRSSDGSSWEQLAAVDATAHIDEVLPVDDDTAFVVTDDGALLVTADTQRRSELAVDEVGNVLAGRFVDADYGYLLTSSPRRLLGTENGGITWTPLE